MCTLIPICRWSYNPAEPPGPVDFFLARVRETAFPSSSLPHSHFFHYFLFPPLPTPFSCLPYSPPIPFTKFGFISFRFSVVTRPLYFVHLGVGHALVIIASGASLTTPVFFILFFHIECCCLPMLHFICTCWKLTTATSF